MTFRIAEPHCSAVASVSSPAIAAELARRDRDAVGMAAACRAAEAAEAEQERMRAIAIRTAERSCCRVAALRRDLEASDRRRPFRPHDNPLHLRVRRKSHV